MCKVYRTETNKSTQGIKTATIVITMFWRFNKRSEKNKNKNSQSPGLKRDDSELPQRFNKEVTILTFLSF